MTLKRRAFGMAVMELLCVIAIISILAAIYLAVIARAFVHIKKFLGKQTASDVNRTVCPTSQN
jgi:prepilin-type N-terminal cleavage/methylation domain-containing protein